jgi:cytochrome P450
MTAESQSDIPRFPVPRERLFSPPSVYTEWRRQGPLRRVAIRDERRAWAVTRYDDIKAVLNSEHTSANRLDPRFPNLRAGVVTLTPDSNIMHMDPPEHGRYRRMLMSEFTGRRIKAMQPEIQQYADDAVDRLLASEQPVDFYRAVALPIPSQVICLLLGIDYDKHTIFEALTKRLLDMTTSPEEFAAALRETEDFMRDEVEMQRENPRDGVIGKLMVEQVRTGEITQEQLVGFSMLILIGGHEATAKAITLGMVTLLNEPEQADAIRRDPQLMRGAIEEILRIHSITDLTTPKLATADMTVGGCPVKAGEGLFPLIASANHDPDIFPDPETFDPSRSGKGHLTFGSGPHVCLGQYLARAEMEAVFSTVITRVPSMQLAVPVEELELDREAIAWGVKALPVIW